MILDAILVIICLSALIAGSITDLQRREVPNWINYGLLITVLTIRLLYSVFTADISPILFGIYGLAIGYAVAALMYYSGQWGGGDAKMLMGLGAAFGSYIPPFFQPDLAQDILMIFTQNAFLLESNMLFIPILVLNIFLFGALYGLSWMVVLSVKHFLKVAYMYKTLRQKYIKIVRISYGSLLLVVLGIFFAQTSFGFLFIVIPVAFFLLTILSLLIKSIEKVCMIKDMNVSELTEGEWIVKDVVVKGKRICGPKDLGITNAQIAQLKKLHVKSVPVKIGIPFIPAFLMGFIFTLVVGNPIAILLVVLL